MPNDEENTLFRVFVLSPSNDEEANLFSAVEPLTERGAKKKSLVGVDSIRFVQ